MSRDRLWGTFTTSGAGHDPWRRVLGRLLLSWANRAVLLLPPRRFEYFWRTIYSLAGYNMGPHAWIESTARVVGSGISLGANSFVHMESLLVSEHEARIEIGCNVGIGPRCCLTAVTHDVGPPECRRGPAQCQDIVIGDGTWIGANVTIIAGVTIGPGCVVGAGSVVRRDLPPHAVAIGNPARVLQALPQYEE